jgi:hypothetical protein
LPRELQGIGGALQRNNAVKDKNKEKGGGVEENHKKVGAGLKDLACSPFYLNLLYACGGCDIDINDLVIELGIDPDLPEQWRMGLPPDKDHMEFD